MRKGVLALHHITLIYEYNKESYIKVKEKYNAYANNSQKNTQQTIASNFAIVNKVQQIRTNQCILSILNDFQQKRSFYFKWVKYKLGKKESKRLSIMGRLQGVKLQLTCVAQDDQYNIKIMKQLVTLDFKKDQGLIIRWNCANMSRPNKYFRHIIVILASDTKLAREALDNYIRNIKLGDLYTAVYQSKGAARIREWREKTNRSQGGEESYLKQQVGVSFNLEEMCGIIQQQIQQFGEPTVVNFVLQQQREINNLKLKIREMQVEGRIKFITTIFSTSPENHVSISQGINELCLEDRFIFEFFHHYLNQMAIEQAHLSIACRNGQINSCSQEEWRNTAFNKIERKYYGPSIRYNKDVLHFINSKIIFSGQYDLDIELKFRCFGGTSYTAYKHVAISFDNQALTNRTVCATRKRRIYYSTEDIALEENPYESQTLVHFELRSQKDQSYGQLQ